MTRILAIDLPGYQRPPLTANQRGHWAKHQPAKQQLRETARLVLAAPARRIVQTGYTLPLTITLEWVVTDKRRRDNDNIAPTLKVVADVLCGLLGVDDSWQYVTSATRIRLGDAMGLRLVVDDSSADELVTR